MCSNAEVGGGGVIYVSVSGKEMVWMMKYGDWRWLKLTAARGHSWGRTL